MHHRQSGISFTSMRLINRILIVLTVFSALVTLVGGTTRPNWDVSFLLNRKYGLTAMNSDLDFPMDISTPEDGLLYSVPAQTIFSDKKFPDEPIYIQLNFQPNTSLTEFYFLTIRDPDDVMRFSLSMYKRNMYRVQMRYNLLESNEGERTIDFPYPQPPSYWRLGVLIKENSVQFFTNCPRFQTAPFHEETGVKLLGRPLFRDGASAYLLNSGRQSSPKYLEGVLTEFTFHSGHDVEMAPCKTTVLEEGSGEPMYTFDPEFGNVIVTLPDDVDLTTPHVETTTPSPPLSVVVEATTTTARPTLRHLVPFVDLSDMSVRVLDTNEGRLLSDARIEGGYLLLGNGSSILLQDVPGVFPSESVAANAILSVDLQRGTTNLVDMESGEVLVSKDSSEGIDLDTISSLGEGVLFELALDDVLIHVDTYNGRWSVQDARTGEVSLVQEVRDGVLYLANGKQVKLQTSGSKQLLAVNAQTGIVRKFDPETGEIGSPYQPEHVDMEVTPHPVDDDLVTEPEVSEPPIVVDQDSTDGDVVTEPEVTESPIVEDQDSTDGDVVTEPEVTESPIVEDQDSTDGDIVTEPEVTESPIVEDQDSTDGDVVTEPEVTESPIVIDQDSTDGDVVTEPEVSEPPSDGDQMWTEPTETDDESQIETPIDESMRLPGDTEHENATRYPGYDDEEGSKIIDSITTTSTESHVDGDAITAYPDEGLVTDSQPDDGDSSQITEAPSDHIGPPPSSEDSSNDLQDEHESSRPRREETLDEPGEIEGDASKKPPHNLDVDDDAADLNFRPPSNTNQSAQEILQPDCACLDKLLTPELVSQLRSKEFGVSTPEDKLYEEVFRTPAFLKVFKEVIEDYFARPGVLERFKPACNCSAQPCTAECNCAAPSPPTTPTPENVLASASSKHILDALKEISHGAIIMENETVLARVAYTLAPGSMVYLNSEDMFYLKVNDKNNIWRTIDMKTQSESVSIPEPPKTTTTTAAPVPLPDDLVGKSLILAAQNGPLNGELRFGAKFGSGHSGAIFTCQRAARQHNLSQLFYPLMNTDVFNMDYVVPPMYRFDLPIVNIRGEILFDDYVHLVNGEQAPQAPILAFDGKDINSDPLAPCVWVGAKPIYLNGDYEFAARSKCRNWQTHDPTERGLAVHVPMNSNSVGFFDESNLYEESCVKRCNILCIQISPK